MLQVRCRFAFVGKEVRNELVIALPAFPRIVAAKIVIASVNTDDARLAWRYLGPEWSWASCKYLYYSFAGPWDCWGLLGPDTTLLLQQIT